MHCFVVIERRDRREIEEVRGHSGRAETGS